MRLDPEPRLLPPQRRCSSSQHGLVQSRGSGSQRPRLIPAGKKRSPGAWPQRLGGPQLPGVSASRSTPPSPPRRAVVLVAQVTRAGRVLEQAAWPSGCLALLWASSPRATAATEGLDKPASHQDHGAASASPAQRPPLCSLPAPPRCGQGVLHATHLSPWTLLSWSWSPPLPPPALILGAKEKEEEEGERKAFAAPQEGREALPAPTGSWLPRPPWPILSACAAGSWRRGGRRQEGGGDASHSRPQPGAASPLPELPGDSACPMWLSVRSDLPRLQAPPAT